MDLKLPDIKVRLGLEPEARALASYVRTIVSGNSPYDKYANGKDGALSKEARLGLSVFRGNGRSYRSSKRPQNCRATLERIAGACFSAGSFSLGTERSLLHVPATGPTKLTPPNSQRSNAMPRLATLLIIWLILALGYAAYRHYDPSAHTSAKSAPDAAPSTPLPTVGTDSARHLADALTALGRTEAQGRALGVMLRHALAQADAPAQVRELQRALGALDSMNNQLSHKLKLRDK